MTPTRLLSLVFAFLIGLPALAGACTLTPEGGGPAQADVRTLSPGTFTGHIDCDGVRRHLSVWTMDLDPATPNLGVRDDPLFESVSANPLMQVARVGYDNDIHFTLYRRTVEPAGRSPVRQLFATVCAGAGDPLNCSLGRQRVKMRIELRDVDMDGQPDRAYHQISIYDGASRLQVIYVDLAAHPRSYQLVGSWISFFGTTGILDLESRT